MQFDQKLEASNVRSVHSGQARIDSSQLGDIPEERIGHRYATQTNFNLRSPKGVGGPTRSAVLRSMSYGRQAVLRYKAAAGRPSYAVQAADGGTARAAGSRPLAWHELWKVVPLLSCSPSLRFPKEGVSVSLPVSHSFRRVRAGQPAAAWRSAAFLGAVDLAAGSGCQ